MNYENVISKSERVNYGTKLSFGEKVCYGVGDLASNLMWGVIGSFLLYFYTDVALIPVAATGSIFLVSRVLDAFIDPVIGGFVDRTNTKWGRTKPYIMFGVIPLCVIYVLTFTTIGTSISTKIIYACITYIIAGILFSVVNVPYGALMSLMTRDTNEKTQLASFRMFGMAVGSIIVTAGTMPLVNLLGNGNQQRGFILTTILFSIIGFITFMIIVKNCKERYVENVSISNEKYSILETYKSAFRNGPWVATLLFSVTMFIKNGAIVAITIYFCLQVLKDPTMISILLPLLFVTMIISSALTPVYLNKFKHRKGNIIALCIYIAGFCLLPFCAENKSLFITIYFFTIIFNGFGSASVFGMTADSVDYNEWKFGKRSEGTLYAGYSFANRVGFALGSAMVGYMLAFAGYDAINVTDSAVSWIKILYYGVPIVFSILQIISVSFYKLDKIHPQIIVELNERIK